MYGLFLAHSHCKCADMLECFDALHHPFLRFLTIALTVVQIGVKDLKYQEVVGG